MPNIRVNKRADICYLCGPTYESLYRFPKDVRLIEWCRFCNADSVDKLPKGVRICVEHFDASQRIVEANEYKLRCSAIPTIRTANQLERLKSSAAKHHELVTEEQRTRSALKDTINIRFQELNVKAPVRIDVGRTKNQKHLGMLQMTPTRNKGITVHQQVTLSDMDSEIQDIDIEIVTPSAMDNEVQDVDVQKVTPTTIVRKDRPTSAVHSLRYIADIRLSDLEDPVRRVECLKIIRFENEKKSLKLRSEIRRNRRLKIKVKILKQLVSNLRKKNTRSTDCAVHLMVN